MRLYKANQRVQDPDLDNLSNPHEVKHWMDPKLIPFAWGFYNEQQQEEKLSVESSLVLAGGTLAVRTKMGGGGGVRRKYPCNHI